MKEITAKRDRVLETIRANRTKHQTEYKEALAEYAQKLAVFVQKKVDEIKAGAILSPNQLLPPFEKPQDHTESYDVAITLLEYEIREDITLDTADVESYLMDRWTWMKSFKASYESIKSIRV